MSSDVASPILAAAADPRRLAVASAHTRPIRPNALSASVTLAWRSLLKLRHVPAQLIDVTLFPILITLMFGTIFGGALAGSVENYLQTLIPGILVMTVVMITMYTALGLNADIANGIFDRFRSLSFWRPAVLVGALLGDAVRYATASLVVVALGVALGFRPEAGPAGVGWALLLVLLFAFSLSWIWTVLGLLFDDPKSVSMISSLASFPLGFASNVFVDPATMPAVLQPLVSLNPVSVTVGAVRGLMHGHATSADIAAVLLCCAVLIGLFAPLTMHLYNRKNR